MKLQFEPVFECVGFRICEKFLESDKLEFELHKDPCLQ